MLIHTGHDATEVAAYMLSRAQSKGLSLTPMQLQKLVYICHGWMLGIHGRPLIRESVEAWTYGPVVRSLYREYKRFGGASITEAPTVQVDEFDEEERSIMDQVMDLYGAHSGVHLSALTHNAGTPWDITRRSGGMLISNDLIEQHYRQLATSNA